MAKPFAQNLCYFRAIFFCELLRMKRNEFCATFIAQFAQNRKYFLRKLRMKQNFSFSQFFWRNLLKTASFTQNVTF